jgi:uncharacterized protein (UPF0332 family)
MTTAAAVQVFWAKALENAESAASEFISHRCNASANRAYHAVFQAAIVALLRAGIRPPGPQWGHAFVQAQFSGQLIMRRKIYPSGLRDTLPRLEELRERADYGDTHVSQAQAQRAVRRAQEFLGAVQQGGQQP